MKSRLFFLPLIAMISLFSTVSAQKFIGVKGENIIGPDGKPFLIRGTNLGNWLVPEGYMFKLKKVNSPRLINEALVELIGPDATKVFWKKYLETYITSQDIHYLKSLGMNSIRIPFNYRLFTNEDYLGGKGEARGFALMDKVIGWCKKEGLYVILDMHCAPGGQTGDNIDDGYGYPFIFENAESAQLATEIWKKIAAHYKNETAIMGYDILNEPIAHYFDKAKLNPLLEPLYKKIVKAVREVDPNHLVFLGGAQWDSDFSIFGSPFDPKAVYTFHKYWTATTQDVIQSYLDFRTKFHVPIYCGETGENKDEWVSEFRMLLEKNNVGWHYWPYKKLENVAGIVTFKMPQGFQDFIDFAESDRATFEEIRKARPAAVESIKKALDGFLENAKFPNCTPNTGYIKALGFELQ
ncbi:MAG: glycosyl hydrolase family 5 [Bacteroidetes bacterium]|nr:MAG: glycosyl hydrolase family 5 [Bacteroidota bacterium]